MDTITGIPVLSAGTDAPLLTSGQVREISRRIPMTCLLDVNALVALGFFQHEFHQRMAAWVYTSTAKGVFELATCSITELGFVRILTQAPQYGFTVLQACDVLLRLKSSSVLPFIGRRSRQLAPL